MIGNEFDSSLTEDIDGNIVHVLHTVSHIPIRQIFVSFTA